MKKSLVFTIMLLSGIALMVASESTLTRTEKVVKHPRGQPEVQPLSQIIIEYNGVELSEVEVINYESIITQTSGENPAIKEDVVMNIGIRRERDVDSCSVVPISYISCKKDARKTIKEKNTNYIRADNLMQS